MSVALGHPFHDATSGMYAVNAKAMPILAEPYDSGAPEVESLLRLREAGLRVVEVPVHMRERAGGESRSTRSGDVGAVTVDDGAAPDRSARILERAQREGAPPGVCGAPRTCG